MPEAVVDQLEVVQVDEDDRDGAAKARCSLDLRLERRDESPPIDETCQLIGHRLSLDDVVQAGVLQRDRRLRGEPLGQLLRFGRKAARRRVEQQPRGAGLVGGRQLELQLVGVVGHVTHPADLPVALHEPATANPGRLGDHVEDHGKKRARIVRRGERVADEGKRLPRVRPVLRRCAGGGRAGGDLRRACPDRAVRSPRSRRATQPSRGSRERRSPRSASERRGRAGCSVG